MGREEKFQASEQLVQRIRRQAKQEMRGVVSELLTQAVRERASGTVEDRHVVEDVQLKAVRDEGARVRAEVERVWAAKFKEANEAATEALKSAREDADRQLIEKVASVRAEGQRVLEAALEAARQEADRNLEARVNQVRRQAENIVASELATEPVEAFAPEEPGTGEVLGDVLGAVRRLNEASSLTEALDALGQTAGEHVSRAAVLTVQEDQVRGWSFVGFGDALERDARRVALAVGETGLIGRAVVAAASCEIGTDDEPSDDLRPPFAGLQPGTGALASPIRVGGQVMAVLYGDDQGETTHPAWRQALEILARHAGHCLEALTATRAAQLVRYENPDHT